MEAPTQVFETHPFKEGQLLAGRYRILSYLGAGSMGWVLKVADEALAGEAVALKILYPHLSRDSLSVLRFRQEVILARQLAHPSIIHVHDFEENPEGETFIAMEYIEGASLEEILKGQRGAGLPFNEALLILSKIAEGLLYAHQQGVIHRDLKPSNILIGRDGSIKISDFGLAKSFQQEFGLTRTGEALGTPLYMAPEQFRAEDTDQRTDIYAFGILAFELVTGCPPFCGDDFFALAQQHIGSPLPLDSIAATPDWFRSLIESCCAKDPQNRPLSVTDFLPLLVQKLPEATQLQMALRHLGPTRRLSRRAQRRALIVFWIVVGYLLFHAAYAQTNTKVFIGSNLLIQEYRLGIELKTLKWLLGIRGSLLRPESAFELFDEPKGRSITLLLTADREVHDDSQKKPWLSDVRDKEGYTLLQRAASLNSSSLMDAFSAAHTTSQFNLLDPEGDTVLTATLRHRRTQAFMGLMTNRSFQIDGVDAQGEPPIHIAIRNQLLVPLNRMIVNTRNSGAYLRNTKGEHAIHLAARLHDVQTLNELARVGVDLGARDMEGGTVLMEAVRSLGPTHEVVQVINWLLESGFLPRGAGIDALDNDGKTALIHAIVAKNEAAANTLIAHGASVSVSDRASLTAHDYALQAELPGLAQRLNEQMHSAASPQELPR